MHAESSHDAPALPVAIARDARMDLCPPQIVRRLRGIGVGIGGQCLLIGHVVAQLLSFSIAHKGTRRGTNLNEKEFIRRHIET